MRTQVTCALPVTTAVRNRYDSLHGGCTATLVDVVGTVRCVAVVVVVARSHSVGHVA